MIFLNGFVFGLFGKEKVCFCWGGSVVLNGICIELYLWKVFLSKIMNMIMFVDFDFSY